MVTTSYMLERPAPPSRTTAFVHQTAVPALIDAAGAMEMRLQRLSVIARRAPLVSVGAALGVGWLLYRVVGWRR